MQKPKPSWLKQQAPVQIIATFCNISKDKLIQLWKPRALKGLKYVQETSNTNKYLCIWRNFKYTFSYFEEYSGTS